MMKTLRLKSLDSRLRSVEAYIKTKDILDPDPDSLGDKELERITLNYLRDFDLSRTAAERESYRKKLEPLQEEARYRGMSSKVTKKPPAEKTFNQR